MELVCLDFWSAEDNKQRSVDVLVLTDHFTKLAHAFPCTNQQAKQVAKKLWDNVFCVYGFPGRIHTDQGTNFESDLVAELLKLSGVSKSHTTAYHPMGNGGTERFNRTLGSMLRSLPLREKAKWPQQIQTLTFAYNATVHETTGYAPFHLMFGRVPRLPIDVMFKQVLHDPVVVDYGSYVTTLMSHLREAADIAQRHAIKEQDKQARGYNRRVKGTCLNVGDRVLLANKGERGKKKLADKWEPTVYTVVGCNPQTHIYKLEDSDGRTRVVHRNLLLDISFLPVTSAEGGPSDTEDGFDDSEDESQMEDTVDSLEEEDSGDRTSAWVLSGAEDVSHQSDSEVDESDRNTEPDQSVAPDAASVIDASSVQSFRPVTVPAVYMSDTVSSVHTAHAPTVIPGALPRVEEERGRVSQGPTQPDMQGVVRTRAGRVVRKVDRLIETMVQEPLSMGGFAYSFR
ncbi:uncharacterized protein LOC133423270 [Cololabis saira]|uniref:uncharacterized protein LOC133423270 n=1 Tax=Cololabis saira TaxID=129043 RepID=UPI002AD4ABFE|nr:uncharacterized protein LOC133423270 [Cololabis saira]